jgi:peptidoglycan/xylan/chitin deacetylase (PgdA/CDA1 family)
VFVVTFDDGYANNYTQALPILADLKVPATVFLATAYIGSDQPFPSDDWSARGSSAVPVDSWQPLSLEQCRELQASGLIELGAHTHTHQDFRGRLDDFRNDLRQNHAFLQEHLGLATATFAFPYGTKRLGFSGPALARVVREARFACALTTEADLADIGDDPFDWGRFQVDQRDSAALIAGKLAGWYGVLRSTGRQLLSQLSFRRNPSPETTAFVPLRLGRFR